MSLRNILAICLVGLGIMLPVKSQTNNIDDILSGMNLENKVAQMFMASFFGETLNQPIRDFIETYQPGAFVLLPSNLKNPTQITRLTNDIQQTLLDNGSIPAFIAVDQEGGIISHLEDGFTQFPVPSLVTATQNQTLAYQTGQAIAREMMAVGLNMNLAPVADLHTNPDNPIINRRSFGSYPEQVAPIVSSIVRGMQDTGVLATAKHFPGHGDTNTDSHLELPVLMMTADDLKLRELQPFEATMQASVGAVMVGHINFPLIDDEPNLPASLSRNVVNNLLREDLAYDGIIITDALDMDAIDTVYSPEEAAIRAVQAGNDMIILGAHVSPDTLARAIEAVVDAVQQGEIDEAQIDQSVRRILQKKMNYVVLDWQPANPEIAGQTITAYNHTALIEAIFEAGITIAEGELLSNIGETSFIFPANRQSLWQACRNENFRAIGYSTNPTNEEIQWASLAAQSVDRVVVITENAEMNAQQQRLVASLPPEKTVVVAIWSPYDNQVLTPTAGYMITYSPLRELYAPLCAILRGEQAPRGTRSIDLR